MNGKPLLSEAPRKELLKLNLGSSGRKLPGFLNVDNNPSAAQADVVHNLDQYPWPFDDGSVQEIVMDHSLEHLEDTIAALLEIYRISANGARIEIRVPHFSCAWTHPGHKRALGVGLFDHFNPEEEEHYGNCRFEVESVKLHWMRPRYRTNWLRKAVVGAIDFLANLSPRVCQRVWCYWIGGFEEIEFRVRVVKP